MLNFYKFNIQFWKNVMHFFNAIKNSRWNLESYEIWLIENQLHNSETFGKWIKKHLRVLGKISNCMNQITNLKKLRHVLKYNVKFLQI